jgi:peptidoglycan/xylan/chitin deacetylase (PgdA/CDA1 family)
VALRQLVRSAIDAWEVPRDLLLGRYPGFVSGGPLRPGEIPVFVFHGVEPEGFGRKLRHLADNDYRTLSVDEYLAVIRGQTKPPERAVLLTFDDGRGSVWTVAAPLLRRHGMKAVVFLVPGRMSDGCGPTATWDDVQAGRSDPASVLERESGAGALLSWAEVEALARAGGFDFQSHTLRHARIHTGPQLAGFVTPRSRQGYDAFDQPLVRAGERDLLGAEVPLGTPLLRSAPRISDAARFFEDEAVRSPCVEIVAESGGEAFFRNPGWERRLRRAFGSRSPGGTWESAESRAQAVASELTESRRLIEERTGRPVIHLCYPWHAAGTTARRLAIEAGYVTAFCGKVAGAPVTRPGGDLRSLARIGEDYVELLPGAGRATLAEVLRAKWRRRFGRPLE